jgi:formate C-acetyltransferase
MRDRINQLPADTPLGYRERLAILRQRKLEDTQDKAGYRPFADGDDYGAVMPPADFSFSPYINHQNGSWYGYDGWSRNFYTLMSEHPVFIDPCDAFPNRWMNCMSWLKGVKQFNPDYSYAELEPEQERYGILAAIYRVGLELGWGGLLAKLEHYRGLNPGKDAFYDAEELVIRGIQTWMNRTVAAIDEAVGRESHPVLRENLRTMGQSTSCIIENPPRTLRQACEWICWFNMASREYNRDGAGDQLDELLRPYYEADLVAGRIDPDEARYYIACLLLNDPHYYQVGGLPPTAGTW